MRSSLPDSTGAATTIPPRQLAPADHDLDIDHAQRLQALFEAAATEAARHVLCCMLVTHI